ncbi:helix-turn-helix domain-containing protein [Streptomyces smyrnaeus]|uniref:Helix-turn-helix domain-containing protein n=1 Tax=Streptomyces smyrnaeus TaxID=1387713 RepID=A0ABS3XRS4_9ACTN|nr:helix-turn-helix domain-containing protein [Streptomyces smyrnaeus]MBO8198108.1 helix-turn-helix domain-containing protein [Streptomyces smyrnaeus]
MYDINTRRRALALVAQGRSLNSVSKQTGISRWCLRSWQQRLHPSRRCTTTCERCSSPPRPPADVAAYSYLLGLYLGDGCVSRLARTYTLRIACADVWPGLIDACEQAMRLVRPENKVCRVQRPGCVNVTAYSSHWPCLFPQHGPGRKHGRRIVLAPWQQEIVDVYPWELIRGLVHSDGCRITNWTTRMVGGQRKRYEYPRYFFTNKSDDVRQIYCRTLDQVGVEWKVTKRGAEPYNISVARRASVALMDAHVGAKY